MSTVFANASLAATATAYGSQRRVDRCQNGVLWAIMTRGDGNANFGAPSYSTDNGATWTSASSIPNGSGAGATTYITDASLFIDLDDYAHLVFRDNSNGGLYYTRGTPNTGRTAYSWSTPYGFYPGAGEDLPDVVAHRDPANAGAWVAHVVACANSGSGQVVDYTRFTISSAGVINLAASTRLAGPYGATAPCYPALDFRHTGDGKTVAGSSPDVFVGWSINGTGTRFMKLSYSSGSWTPGTERAIDPHYSSGQTFAPMFFDGSRCVFAGLQVSTSTTDIVCHDRDAADTTTTTRTLVASPSAAQTLLFGSTSYDASGNVYLFGAENATAGSANLNWVKWTRASSTLSAKTTIIATSNGAPYISARRSSVGSRIDCIYTQNTAAPYQVNFASIILNSAPNAPVVTLAGGATSFDAAQPLPVAWPFSDPDTGDSQSAYDVRYRVQGASTWVTPAGLTGVTSTTGAASIPAGTFTSGQVAEVQIQDYDTFNTPSGWSASAFSTAGTAPTVAITAPTSGATVAATATLVWAPSSQSAYRWRRVADASGSPVVATVYYDSGVVTGAVTSIPISFDTNSRTEHVEIQVQGSNGLWSAWADVRVLVSYVPPAAPGVLVTLITSPVPGLAVTITAPTPTGGQPAVDHNDVAVDDGLGAGFTRRVTAITASGTWSYLGARGNFDYVGRVRVTAVAANGTSTPTTV